MLHSPVEVDSLLCELSRAMSGVFKWLILDDLHSFAPIALLVAVLADHVQLSDPVLQEKGHRRVWIFRTFIVSASKR